MERAGNEDMSDDVERKGLGTPATRADIIEKLVKDGFVKREKKQMIPTEDGMKLITILPDVVKSPKLTADWENELTLVSKGEVATEQFIKIFNTINFKKSMHYNPFAYIHYIAPVEEQNFGTLITFLDAMEVREDDETFQNPIDQMFDVLEKKEPDHFAVRQYRLYKLEAGDICFK